MKRESKHMKRREFLKAAGAGAAMTMMPNWLRAAASADSDNSKRPNIVIILADDMGYSDIGCYGSEISTPNLDRLAAGGIRFTQFYNTARCCPTRASLLTGLHPHQAGIGHMANDYGQPGYIGHLADRCVTIAEALRPAGYSTMMSGKWHVGKERPNWPIDRGFDESFTLLWGASGYWKHKNGPTMVTNDVKAKVEDENFYMTDAISDHAVKFIDDHGQRANPFFLYVAYTAPHWPLHAHQKDIDKYRGKYMAGWDALRAERHARMVELGLVDKSWPLTPRDPAVPEWEQLDHAKQVDMDLRMAIYAAQIECMDRGIGQIVDQLRQQGTLDNTLILFLADNGACAEVTPYGFDKRPGGGGRLGTKGSWSSYGMSWANASNTPFRLYKHWVHEGGIATPLIAHWPSAIRQKGQLTHQPGHIVDLMATCCDIGQATYPQTRNGTPVVPLEGKSLLPILRGKQRKGHDAIFWEHEGNRAVRMGKWKLVSRLPLRWELYDMSADRTEMNNLAAEHPDLVEKMSAMYDDWAARSYVLPWASWFEKEGEDRQRGDWPYMMPL